MNNSSLPYINNLSSTQFSKIHNGLLPMESYVGNFDLSYSSHLKTIISSILVRSFLKCKKKVINASEGSQDINMMGYPFEVNGYQIVGIEEMYYGLFLSYKIEREVFQGYESDTEFSLNALSIDIEDLSQFNVFIEKNKHQYLLTEKGEIMRRANLSNLSINEIEEIIRSKIRHNYIYNLTQLPEHNTIKFNIVIEVLRSDIDKPMKLTAGLEYQAVQKRLRLITLF